MPWWPSAIPGPALIRRISIESSTPSTPRSPVEQGWGCRYAAPSLRLMGASYGRKRTSLAAPCFSSPCPEPKERSRCDRSKLRYPSDLTDDEWKLVEPLIPPGKPFPLLQKLFADGGYQG